MKTPNHSKTLYDLLGSCNKTENHTSSIADEDTEMRQKLLTMDERKTEMNKCIKTRARTQ